MLQRGASVEYPMGYGTTYEDYGGDDDEIPVIDEPQPEKVVGGFLASNPPTGY